MGFNVPKLSISEGKVELFGRQGQGDDQDLPLGQAGSADDIQGSGSGDVILGRNWDASTLNAKINFKLSENILKAFVLIDALLGPGKQGDGSSLLLPWQGLLPPPTPCQWGVVQANKLG